ncbi:MAG: hypothetical protein NZ521_10460, partial [Flammeovirgaceae bacterium]|nr:hypothetical protein [Flammeovirgaceae bacterium]
MLKRLNEANFVLEQLKKSFEEQKQQTENTKKLYAEGQEQLKAKQNLLYQLKKNVEISEVQRSGLKQELERETQDTQTHSESLHEFDQRLSLLRTQLDEKNNRQQALLERQEQL